MKLISWNVNGVNACLKKGLNECMQKENASVYCFQEMKCQKEKIPPLQNYHAFHSFAHKKGYSGVSIYTKTKPISVTQGIQNHSIDSEGRVLTAEFEKYFVVNAYFPHAHRELKRLPFKLEFNNIFLKFCQNLQKKKPIIIASDFNVAHKEIDLTNPKQNEYNAGFTRQERAWFDSFVQAGFIDTFREFTSDGGNYTWWAYHSNARERNIGWRIDYFAVSSALKENLTNSTILKDVRGSDHCPIKLEIK